MDLTKSKKGAKMRKILIPVMAVLCLGIIACKDIPVTAAECSQTLCTKEHCYVWSAELNRCGTAEALKKEEARLKKIAKAAENKDSAKVVLPKAVRDSLAKIEKKQKTIKYEIHELKKDIDSIRVVDSTNGTSLMAATYLKNKLDMEKEKLNAKYKTMMDSIEMLNLINRKPITAVQWLEYNKRKKKAKLDRLEK